MTLEEAQSAVEKKNKNGLLRYTFSDTIYQVLMDLYISYQDNTEDAHEERKIIKDHIFQISQYFWSWTRDDNYIYHLEDRFNETVAPEILDVLNFILKIDSKKPKSIPEIFEIRLKQVGRSLTLEEFYKYK